MKLNKSLKTITIIILLIINLIFFSFLIIGKKLGDKKFINEIVQEFNFKEYLNNNEIIKRSINNYKYPKEVFNELDNLRITNIKLKVVNNLFEKKEYLINKEDIIDLLNDSVYEYEKKYSIDIYDYVKKDIEDFSYMLENKLNDEFINNYYSVLDFSKGIIYYISIILTITFIVFIILLEKRNGFLITSIILILYSFFSYYVSNYFLDFVFKNKLNYFNSIHLEISDESIICFISGFVLLLIYIIKSVKKLARNIRVNSYNRR